MSTRREVVWIVPAFLALVVLLAVPRLSAGSLLHLAAAFVTYAVMALAWGWLASRTGYVDLGAVVFYGLGGYVAAILSTRLPLAIGVLAGGLVCALFAAGLGSVLLRQSVAVFAAATFGVSQGVREVASHWTALTGGVSGLPLAANAAPSRVYEGLVLLVACVCVVGWRLQTGRAKPGVRTNLGLYALAGAAIGLAGGAQAAWLTFVDPGTQFDIGISLEIAAMGVLGGTGGVVGPLLGAGILTVLSEGLEAYAPSLHLVVIALLLAVVALWRPRGIAGLKSVRQMLSWLPAGLL